MKRYLIFFIGFSLCLSGLGYASVSNSSDNFFKRYYEIRSVEIRETLDEGANPLILRFEESSAGAVVDEVDVTLDKIIGIGNKAWKIIDANKPVVRTTVETASALPEGITRWQDLEGWQVPHSRYYSVVIVNAWGMEVVRFGYRVLYSAGGSFRGQGRYLSNVTIVPAKVDVLWSFKFDANVLIQNVLNVGTVSDPIAGIQMGVRFTVDSPLAHIQSEKNFFVRGDGEFFDLHNRK